MEKGYWAKQTLLEIVDAHFTYASALHFCGISFYEYPQSTLAQVCQQKGISIEKVVAQLHQANEFQAQSPNLHHFQHASLESIISYLKQTHRRYIRYQLPYMANLVENICADHFDDANLANDLKFVFPLFMEDFIHHVKEEEQVLFGFILRLRKATKGNYNLGALWLELREKSLQKFYEHHQEDDDEMAGIRSLTNNYYIDEKTGTYTKVIFSELLNFERDLKAHSYLENHVLFPKAFALEEEAYRLITKKAKWN